MTGKEILQKAICYEQEIQEIRRQLHQNPEVGFDIPKTKKYVQEKLKAYGYHPIECGKAGLIAIAGGKKSGKVILLRADMDALPIKEETDLDFCSKNGKMHACGHDMHTAMLLGAAKILKEQEDEIEGTVKLMFQPAEEILEGAKDMVEKGVLENPKVDAAMMLHVMADMPFPSGSILVSAPGVSAPAADYFKIKVQGKGCHGSMPNKGVDSLTVAAHILIALQEIHARELACNEQVVLTIGSLHAGEAANVIPDVAIMSGCIRTFAEDTRVYVKKRLIEIAEDTAITFRAKADVEFGSGCPALKNQTELSVFMENTMPELLGEEKVFSVSKLKENEEGKGISKLSGSEDFAYISRKVPSIMLALAAGEPKNGYSYPQHHPKVQFDESVLPIGCAVYVYSAIRWLQEQK